MILVHYMCCIVPVCFGWCCLLFIVDTDVAIAIAMLLPVVTVCFVIVSSYCSCKSMFLLFDVEGCCGCMLFLSQLHVVIIIITVTVFFRCYNCPSAAAVVAAYDVTCG